MPHCARERRSQPVHWPHWDSVAVVTRFCNIWILEMRAAACNPHFQSLLALFTLHHWQLKLALGNALWVYIAGLGWRKHRERHVSIGVASLSQCHQGDTNFCGRLYNTYEYRGPPSNSFCSYIFASLLVAIIRLQQGAPREGGEASPSNQAFVGHVAMDIIWNLGDVERRNPNTPAPEYSRLEDDEEPHLAINFRSIYDDDVHTCTMMAARFVPGSPSGMMI